MSAEEGAGAAIKPSEPLARFIYSSSHFSRENKRVKPNAFMPAADGKTSVFRTSGLDESKTWAIGETIAQKRAQVLHARGDVVAAEVFRVKLAVVPFEPPPRHANIEDWPAEKSAQKLIAIELAEVAKLVMKPDPTGVTLVAASAPSISVPKSRQRSDSWMASLAARLRGLWPFGHGR